MAYEKPNYTQTPNLFFDKHLPEIKSLAELKVTLLILRRTLGWHTEQTKLSLSGIEKAAGLTRKSASAGVSLALERGTIIREPEGQSFTYSANITRAEDTPVENVRQGRKYPSARGESIPELGENLTQSPSSPILVKEKERKIKKEGVVLKPPFAGEEFISTLADFEEHRTEIKKPLTDKARKILYGKLKKLGEDTAVQVMQESIMNRWQGIFEPRNGNGHSPPKANNLFPEEKPFRPSFDQFMKIGRFATKEAAMEVWKDQTWSEEAE